VRGTRYTIHVLARSGDAPPGRAMQTRLRSFLASEDLCRHDMGQRVLRQCRLEMNTDGI
jgi:hypothetical protein